MTVLNPSLVSPLPPTILSQASRPSMDVAHLTQIMGVSWDWDAVDQFLVIIFFCFDRRVNSGGRRTITSKHDSRRPARLKVWCLFRDACPAGSIEAALKSWKRFIDPPICSVVLCWGKQLPSDARKLTAPQTLNSLQHFSQRAKR